MRQQLSLLVLVMAVLFGSCAKGPKEDELKSRFKGLYCNGFYKLELKDDMTYRNQRIIRSIYTNMPVMEECEGSYAFERNSSGGWDIVFKKSDKNSNKLISCEGRMAIWDVEKGYLSPDSAIVLNELTEQVEVTLNQCD